MAQLKILSHLLLGESNIATQVEYLKYQYKYHPSDFIPNGLYH